MEKNNELPNGWELVKTSEVSKLIRGVTYEKSDSSKIPKTNLIGILRATNIQSKLTFEKLVYVPKKYVNEEQLIKKNDVVISMSSGSKHLVGKSSQSLNDTDVSFGTFCACIRPLDIINGKYFGYFFKSDSYNKSIQSKSLGVNINNLRKEHVENIEIPIPPLNEQKKIVKKIEDLFLELEHSKITLMIVKTQLKQYTESLLKSAFEGKLTEKWRLSNAFELHLDWFDYSNQRKKIENNSHKFLNDIITIADEHCWIDFNSIIDSMKNGIYKPKKFYSDKGIACLRMYNIENNKLVWKKIKRMILTSKEISEYQLLPNDILVNRVNSLELVGKSALIPHGLEKCIFESKNIRLRVKTEHIDPKYVYFWIIIGGRHYFYKNFQQTTGMASINQIQLGNLPIPYCTIDEQKEIISQIEQGLSLIENTENIVSSMMLQLDTLHLTILKQAFEGKLVPQDPNDEPASELLKRIKLEN